MYVQVDSVRLCFDGYSIFTRGYSSHGRSWKVMAHSHSLAECTKKEYRIHANIHTNLDPSSAFHSGLRLQVTSASTSCFNFFDRHQSHSKCT